MQIRRVSHRSWVSTNWYMLLHTCTNILVKKLFGNDLVRRFSSFPYYIYVMSANFSASLWRTHECFVFSILYLIKTKQKKLQFIQVNMDQSLLNCSVYKVPDGRVVRAGVWDHVSVTWNVLSWSRGHEFEPRSGRTCGAWYFCPKSYLNQNINVSQATRRIFNRNKLATVCGVE